MLSIQCVSPSAGCLGKNYNTCFAIHAYDNRIMVFMSNVSTAGEFICEVETYGEPISQHNQLEVLGEFWYLSYEVNQIMNNDVSPQSTSVSSISVPPSISLLNPNAGKLSVRKGSNVRLACNATGYPAPTILWQREVSKGGPF